MIDMYEKMSGKRCKNDRNRTVEMVAKKKQESHSSAIIYTYASFDLIWFHVGRDHYVVIIIMQQFMFRTFASGLQVFVIFLLYVCVCVWIGFVTAIFVFTLQVFLFFSSSFLFGLFRVLFLLYFIQTYIIHAQCTLIYVAVML